MRKLIIAMFVAVLGIASCGSKGSTAAKNEESMTTEIKTSDKRPRVEFETSLGKIVVELYNETPQHRDNMLKLVNEGYYEGILFHRVIREFMIQAGDPNSKTATANQSLGSGGPGYTIEAEIVYPQFFHKRGALAAARTGDQVNPERRSSGSQFYIVTGSVMKAKEIETMEQQLTNSTKQQVFMSLVSARRDEIMQLQAAGDTAGLKSIQDELIAQTEAQVGEATKFTEAQREAYTTIGGAPHLDGQYTVFGEVVEGMDVVSAIENVATGRSDRPTTDIKIIKAQIVE